MHAKDDKNSADEPLRILSVSYTLMTKVLLETLVLAVNWRRKSAGFKDLTHDYLLISLVQEAFSQTG